MDVTPDAVPVIDQVSHIPGFYVATGFSGHGFGIGPGAGRLMADLIAGSTACGRSDALPPRSVPSLKAFGVTPFNGQRRAPATPWGVSPRIATVAGCLAWRCGLICRRANGNLCPAIRGGTPESRTTLRSHRKASATAAQRRILAIPVHRGRRPSEWAIVQRLREHLLGLA